MHRQLSTTLAAALFAMAFASLSARERARAADEPAADTPAAVTVIGSRQAEGVLGKEVRSAADERLGRIVDVVVDRTGQVRAAVIDFGGFFGVGSRRIAVEWTTLSFGLGGEKPDVVTVELTREQIKAAPEYKEKRAVIVLGATGQSNQ